MNISNLNKTLRNLQKKLDNFDFEKSEKADIFENVSVHNVALAEKDTNIN
jgi:hypothetical protein